MQLRQQKGDTGKIKENPNTRAGSIKPKGEISRAQDRVQGTNGGQVDCHFLEGRLPSHLRAWLMVAWSRSQIPILHGVTEYSMHPPPPPQKA